MRREVAVMAVAAILLASACSRLERLSVVRPTAERGKHTQVAPTYDVSDSRSAMRGANADVLVRAAADLLRRGELAEAERIARQAVKADGKSADAHAVLGSVAESRGDIAGAGKHYQAAATLAPQVGIHANNYGAWLCANGRASDSLAWFDRALADTGYPTPLGALSNAGSCAWRAGQPQRAEASWRTVLAGQPTHAAALAGMARMQFERGQYLDARAFAERWLAVAPVDADGLRLAAEIERKLGDNAAASRYLSRLQGIPSASTTSPPAR